MMVVVAMATLSDRGTFDFAIAMKISKKSVHELKPKARELTLDAVQFGRLAPVVEPQLPTESERSPSRAWDLNAITTIVPPSQNCASCIT